MKTADDLAVPARGGLRERADSALTALALVGFATLVVALVLALAVALVPASEAPGSKVPPGDAPASAVAADVTRVGSAGADSFAVTADTSLVFVVQTGNRLYPEWKEERRVRLQERFVIGDTENYAVVTKLLPDFRIIDGKPMSLTREMSNPAVRVLVYRDSAAVDSSWAFLNFPPHFSPRSFFTFQLKEVVGREIQAAPAAPPEGSIPSPKDGAPAAKERTQLGGTSTPKED